MNEIKIYLKTSGRIAELYKDFDLYEGCYRNSQMSVYVPKSLLYENEDGTFANLVKTGAILTAPNGKKLTTKSYYLDYVKTETVVGIAYAVYTIITPKEFCVYAGTQTVVVNVESIDNTDKDNQKVISVTTTQTANLIVLESAYLGQDEPIEPTELDKIKATLTEIEGEIDENTQNISELTSDVDNLSIQVSDLSEDKLDKVSGNTTYKQAYAKDTNGDQIMQNYSTENVTNAIVQRDETGNIKITPGRKGYMNDGATMRNIADVESEVAKKYDKTGGTIDGNVQITGDLNVDGTTTTNDTETLQVKDNFIVTNADGTPLNSLSGIVIRTNANTTYAIVYDPISDSVKLGEGTYTDGKFTFLEGEGEAVAVRDDSTAFTDGHVIVWDAAGDKLVDGGKAVSDLPTLAGNNDFTGENTFEGENNFNNTIWSTSSIYLLYRKDDFMNDGYTTELKNGALDIAYYENGIAKYFTTYQDNVIVNQDIDMQDPVTIRLPKKDGTFALTSDIPTDYATQTALANTQRQVDGLYTLLEQKNEIYVQTATDTYTTRETAGGENIADGVQTPVKKITGKTVKTTNLIPYPYVNGTVTVNGITFTNNGDGSITVNGTATGFASFIFSRGADKINFIGGMTYYFSCRHGIISYLTEEGGEINYIFSDSSPSFTWGEGWIFQSIYIQLNEGQTENNLTVYPMLNEGSTALPYMPYFPGLKNAFFKEIVSTGRNLIPYPYVTKSSTINGVTFTVNNDGTVNVNGTATDGDALFYLVSAYNLSLSYDCYFSGCPAGGSSSSYLLQAYTPAPKYYSDTGSGFLAPANIDVAVVLVVRKGFTANNLVFKPMLNYGSSALPYEPYTQSVLSLPEAVELTEYDTAYPETGEIQRQSKTLTFDGTETWYTSIINDCYAYYVITKPVGVSSDGLISNKITTRRYNAISGQNEGCYISNANFNAIVFWFLQTAYPNLSTSTAWKAQLAAWNEAGNPLTVTYKTVETTTKQADFSADSYIAWKNGSETIEQGDTDNSIYGAENTVEQDYYLLTAPQEVTKE